MKNKNTFLVEQILASVVSWFGEEKLEMNPRAERVRESRAHANASPPHEAESGNSGDENDRPGGFVRSIKADGNQPQQSSLEYQRGLGRTTRRGLAPL